MRTIVLIAGTLLGIGVLVLRSSAVFLGMAFLAIAFAVSGASARLLSGAGLSCLKRGRA